MINYKRYKCSSCGKIYDLLANDGHTFCDKCDTSLKFLYEYQGTEQLDKIINISKSIKNMMIFFTTIEIIGIIGNVILCFIIFK